MDKIFLDLGFSWTLAKVTPYLLTLLAGLFLFVLLKRFHLIIRLIILPIPFIVYFLFFPIYQGDFSNKFEKVETAKSDNFQEGSLSLIAIAGCPYCYEAINDLLIIAERENKLMIDFFVYTDDSTNLDWYKEKCGSAIRVKQIPLEQKRIVSLTHSSFPTFVYRQSNKLTIWSNDNFGVRAKDWVEEQQ